VSGAVRRALVVADMPFGSYEDSPAHAFATAVRLMKEAGAHAVKLEGGRRVAEHVRLLTSSGIAVMGHLGFTPQSENVLGGKRVQGRGSDAAERLSEDAMALQDAGAFAIVLEMVPAPLAARVTPRFAKQYGNVREEMIRAATAYNAEVRSGAFPDDAHSFLE